MNFCKKLQTNQPDEPLPRNNIIIRPICKNKSGVTKGREGAKKFEIDSTCKNLFLN